MTRTKLEMIFSLIFFFFSSFFFITIITSSLFNNFENFLFITLKPNGFFITLSRILLFVGLSLAFYLFFTKHKSKKYKRFNLFGIGIFAILFFLSIISSSNNNELNNVINLYEQKEDYIIVENIKKLVIDSIIFVCFIFFPLLSYFYKKRIYDSYFYKTYIQSVSPSLNTSIMFLFGYTIDSYSFTRISSIIDATLAFFCIILFLRIALNLKNTISFFTIINFLVLVVGFIIFLSSYNLLSHGNLYYASIFFYSIGLLYWFLNISIKLRNNAK